MLYTLCLKRWSNFLWFKSKSDYHGQKGRINLPIVDIKVELKASSENLNSTQVFPTPESPINSSLNR